MLAELPDYYALLIPACQWLLAGSMIMAAWRLFKGPTISDRIVALDLIGALILVQIVLQVVVTGFNLYLDVATALAIISFLATVAFARYLERKDAPL